MATINKLEPKEGEKAKHHIHTKSEQLDTDTHQSNDFSI
jgi:hypothetical protein